MNKSTVKNFAVYARTALINAVTQRAFEYEVTENGKNNTAQLTVNGKALTQNEINQRKQLINRINMYGFRQTVEEVAYTWFNRFIALRFMEVNNYLPSRVRVFSDQNNNFNPEILKNALDVNIEGIDRQYVLGLLDKQQNDTLYKYLLIRQCNALNHSLPCMFEKLDTWTELLFPNNLLRKDSVIAKMISDIPEEDWKNQVQIIGWLYQYYNSEPKDKVFSDLKKNIKIDSVTIPFATQLFTPDWIVRYMVENSLGRLWTDGHGDFDKSEWLYYLDEPEQAENVRVELDKIRCDSENMRPENIRFIDPCMGSGHVLVYAFDVLIQIYAYCGWSARDAVESILKNNLYGLDIDRRAYQLAYFSVMMKARQYNRRILDSGIQPHLADFSDVMGIDTGLLSGNLKSFAGQFADADTIGSLMTVSAPDGLAEEIAGFSDSFGINRFQLDMMLEIYNILGQKYDVVCTNPPYMSSKGMDKTLSDFVKKNFPDSKSDLFSAFVVRCTEITKPNGYLGFLTPYVWMFIQSYEKMRQYIYRNKTIETLIQFEYSAFEEATVPICTFVLRNSNISHKKGCYFRLTDFRGGMEVQRQKTLEAISNHKCGFYFESSSDNFSKIPSSPVAYWVSDNFIKAFEKGISIDNIANVPKGLSTGCVDRFMRFWYEVSYLKIDYDSNSCQESKERGYKWFPYAKGGSYRKWNGNLEYIVNWENDGFEVKNFVDEKGKQRSRPQNTSYYFKRCITYSAITSGTYSVRFLNKCIFGGGGDSIQAKNQDNLYIIMAFLNSSTAQKYLNVISPTMNFEVGHIKSLPVIIDENEKPNVEKLVQENIKISKEDWDSFETSWDFEQHPLI